MSEAAKDPGIDEIAQMNIPDKDKVHYIADLAKHRGRCMDEDGKTILGLKQDLIERDAEILALRQLMITRSPWDNFKIWINGWAKS